MTLTNKNAYTLVEVMVVALISTVVFAGIYSTFIVGNKAWAHYNDSIAVKKEARRALIGMVNELREAQNIRVIHGPHTSAVYFYRPAVGAVSYIWSDQGAKANQIMRYNRLDVRMMAKHITGLSFVHSNNTIDIYIAAGKNTTPETITQIDLREKIALRSQTNMFKH